MGSKLRPETSPSHKLAPSNGTAYWMIYTAVKHQDGLIHGKLHKGENHCAIGCFFDDNPEAALPFDLIDEVAMVNDSVPHMTPRQRKLHVSKWLRWKLEQVGLLKPKAPAKKVKAS